MYRAHRVGALEESRGNGKTFVHVMPALWGAALLPRVNGPSIASRLEISRHSNDAISCHRWGIGREFLNDLDEVRSTVFSDKIRGKCAPMVEMVKEGRGRGTREGRNKFASERHDNWPKRE